MNHQPPDVEERGEMERGIDEGGRPHGVIEATHFTGRGVVLVERRGTSRLEGTSAHIWGDYDYRYSMR